MGESNNLKRGVLAGLALAALLLIFLISVLLSHKGKVPIGIEVTPADSNIYVDGKSSASGEVYVLPGRHIVTAKQAGYQDDSQEVTAGSDKQIVYLIPRPVSQDAINFLKDNPAVQRRREEIGGLRANQRGLQFEEQNPIIKQLPLTDINGPFRIDYGPSSTRKDGIFLEVRAASPEGRANALKWIRQQGQDPTNFEIYFVDFANPLVDGGYNDEN